MEKTIEFIHKITKLKTIKRQGWVREGVPKPESIADHVFRSSIMVLLFAEKFNLDVNKLLKMCLIHDLSEAITGDLVDERGNKIVMDKIKKYEKELTVMENLLEGLEEKDKILQLWKEAESMESDYAKALKKIDRLEMVFQAYEYEGLISPKKLDEFWINAEKHVKESPLEDIFQKIKKNREKLLKK